MIGPEILTYTDEDLHQVYRNGRCYIHDVRVCKEDYYCIRRQIWVDELLCRSPTVEIRGRMNELGGFVHPLEQRRKGNGE